MAQLEVFLALAISESLALFLFHHGVLILLQCFSIMIHCIS